MTPDETRVRDLFEQISVRAREILALTEEDAKMDAFAQHLLYEYVDLYALVEDLTAGWY